MLCTIHWPQKPSTWTKILIHSCRLVQQFNMLEYIFQKVTDKCFRKCVSSPGTSLGSSDQVCVQLLSPSGHTFKKWIFTNDLLCENSVIQKCIAMCMDRYMDSFNLISRVYAERLRKESANMWLGGTHDKQTMQCIHSANMHICIFTFGLWSQFSHLLEEERL